MEAAIFIFYTLLFAYLIPRIRFFKGTGLGKWTLIAVFLLKVLAGLAYAWFYNLPAYHTNSDTYRFFAYSQQETDWLLKNPWAFFRDIFSHGYAGTGNVFIGENSYWNDLKSNVIIKLLAICNVFTGKSYYANIVIFNFLFLFGIMAFHRLLNGLFPNRKWLLLLGVACMPSFLFWCSGIHKDGLLFSALGLAFWFFHQSLEHGFSIKRTVALVLCAVLVFVLRNYVCLALIPAFLGWFLADRTSQSIRSFIRVYVLAGIAFLATSFLPAKFNLLNYFAIKQAEFMQLSGGSSVQVQPLQPSIKGFVSYLPSAVDMAFLRPHITEMKNRSYLPAIAETLFTILLVVVCLVWGRAKKDIPPAVWAAFFFAVTVLLIAGYTITFSGAIVRYRSLVLPFVIAPLLGIAKFSRKKQEIQINL